MPVISPHQISSVVGSSLAYADTYITDNTATKQEFESLQEYLVALEKRVAHLEALLTQREEREEFAEKTRKADAEGTYRAQKVRRA